MPCWQIRGVGNPVSRWPTNRTTPWLGLITPVIRLNKVDLPAPLGPMTARTSPSATRIVTRSTATMPPKRRVSSLISRSATILSLFWLDPGNGTVAGQARRKKAPDAFRGEDDERDEGQTEEQRPGFSVIA